MLIEQSKCILFISSDPSNYEKTSEYSKLLFDGLRHSGIIFSDYLVLDDRTILYTKDYVEKAGTIFLSGGNTYIQNQFFNKIDLSRVLEKYNGVIIGQSAGSINLAENVYNSPEEKELSETIDNNKYTLTTDGQYLVIPRKDNSIIYLNVDSVYKSEIKDIVDELWY